MTDTLPFDVGTASTDANLAADLGKVYRKGVNTFRLVKAAGAISAAASKVLVTAVSSGAPTWSVNTTTTANNGLVAGVVPAGQVDSTGAAGLLSGDYFLLQIGGFCSVLVHTTATAISTGVSTSTTAGSCDAISGTFAATTPGALFASLTAASSGADAATPCRLIGLI
jgi:hypothetical protein